MRTIVDTQIISYAMKGALTESLTDCAISSTVAQEFLRVRNVETGEARYFTPPPHSFGFDTKVHYAAGRIHGRRRSSRPVFRGATDKIVMDFNNQFPSIVEYGHLGMSHLINTANRGIFSESVSHLPKRERKVLIEKFMFLVGQGVQCIPVAAPCITTAFELLKTLIDRGVTLKSDFRNSLNDVLILATAVESRHSLWTMDELLAQLAGDHLLCRIVHSGDRYQLTFPSAEDSRRASRESKGYLNTGWRYAIHRIPAPAKPGLYR
ncbi:hypothetical protein ABZ330_31530 [Streptomyces sp. NPDC006172]|uniref:hypothetical protein n=1 Tax=Streptomyces sp. NPDC006172 TaxID=3154470 RepID=UPI0033F21477